MKNCKVLIQELKDDLDYQISLLNQLKEMADPILNQRSSPDSWSALECVAHLNSYAKHYNPAFRKAIEKSKLKGFLPVSDFQSTWIGGYCIQTVLPENRKKKLKSPGHHNYLSSELNRKVLDVFRSYLEEQNTILLESDRVNLNKTKVSIEIMPWLKLRLGDFLPFLIKHQSRHLLQAMEAAQSVDL